MQFVYLGDWALVFSCLFESRLILKRQATTTLQIIIAFQLHMKYDSASTKHTQTYSAMERVNKSHEYYYIIGKVDYRILYNYY